MNPVKKRATIKRMAALVGTYKILGPKGWEEKKVPSGGPEILRRFLFTF